MSTKSFWKAPAKTIGWVLALFAVLLIVAAVVLVMRLTAVERLARRLNDLVDSERSRRDIALLVARAGYSHKIDVLRPMLRQVADGNDWIVYDGSDRLAIVELPYRYRDAGFQSVAGVHLVPVRAVNGKRTIFKWLCPDDRLVTKIEMLPSSAIVVCESAAEGTPDEPVTFEIPWPEGDNPRLAMAHPVSDAQ